MAQARTRGRGRGLFDSVLLQTFSMGMAIDHRSLGIFPKISGSSSVPVTEPCPYLV